MLVHILPAIVPMFLLLSRVIYSADVTQTIYGCTEYLFSSFLFLLYTIFILRAKYGEIENSIFITVFDQVKLFYLL